MTNVPPNPPEDENRLGIDANDEILGPGGELDADADAKLGETPDPTDGRDPRDL
jgi:hypothetical protein